MRITETILLTLLALTYQQVGAKRRGKRTDVELNSDVDVAEYLKSKDKEMEIFNCKKVVMVQWKHSVLPYVDLECQVLGEVTEVEWSYNDTVIDTSNSGGRFITLSQPHYKKRTFYNSWSDYKLRMLHVTEDDNGGYTMKLTSPSGVVEQRDMMLEVMTDYREEKWIKWMNKVDKDRNGKKTSKRSAAKMAKRRQKELLRQVRKRAKARKESQGRRPQVYEGQ